MPEPDDITLLQEFARTQSDAAFAALVKRHIGLVYSVALRRTADPHASEEISQAVFIVLARKADSLARGTVLSGWLYHAARLTSANHLRATSRRQQREQEAAMQTVTSAPEPWMQIAPLLDDAMATLRERDRNAIVLRYFENRSLAEVGAAIGASEDAARVRVNRALERLRKFFSKRGVTLSTAAIAGTLSANALAAAPAALAVEIARTSAQSSATATTLALVSGTLSSLTRPRYRLAASVCSVLLLATFVLTLISFWKENIRQPLQSGTTVILSNNTNAALPLAATAPPPVREPLSPETLFTLDSPPGAVVIQPDGKIIVGSSLGGFFVNEESGMIGWYGRAAMRFETNGMLDRTFSSDVGHTEYTTAPGSQLALLRDRRVFVSGFFHKIEGKPRHGHAILLEDGRLDESFDAWREGETNVNHRLDYPRLSFSSAMLRDGTIAVMSRPVEGTNPQAAYLWSAYRIDETGRIVWPALTNLDVGRPAKLILTYSDVPHGPFPEVPLELIRYAVRFPDGGGILAVRPPPFGVDARARLQRFDLHWQPDPGFTNEFEAHRGFSDITLHLQKDGKVLVAGMVGKMNGEIFPGLVRLETNGAIDRTFRCETTNGVAGRVMDVAVQEDGRIIICGLFTQVNGTPCERIARLHPDGTLDPTFKTPFVPLKEFQRQRFVRVARLARKPARQVASQTNFTQTNETDSASSGEALERIQISSMNREAGVAVIVFRGRPRGIYVLQAKDSVMQSEWTSISTNAAGGNGSGRLLDPEAQNHPTRFYRIATPGN